MATPRKIVLNKTVLNIAAFELWCWRSLLRVLLCPWDFPGKNTRVDCHFLLQDIFPIQGLNLGLPHCRQTLYHLSHKRSPWTAKRSNQSILKEISPEYSLEWLVLKLKLQYCGHLMQRTNSLGKNPYSGKDWRQEEKGTTEDEMVGWHHHLDAHEVEQAPGVDDGQGSLACYSPWGHKELDTTEQLKWTETL